MKEKIRKFLKDNDFLPLTKWGSFKFVHKGNLPTKEEKKKDFKYIKEQVSNKNGLYIYEKGTKIIYVGKGKPLYNRIKDHYFLAFQELKGDRTKKFHRFFSSKENLGKLKVYWKNLEGEKERQIIERIMDYILNPKFNAFK